MIITTIDYECHYTLTNLEKFKETSTTKGSLSRGLWLVVGDATL